MNEPGHEDVFSFHGHRKPLEMFILEHFLLANRCPLRLKMLNISSRSKQPATVDNLSKILSGR
jgi:hypothetical protein